MTPEEKIKKMTKAINDAIKVLGNRFSSSEGDHQRCIEALKESMKDPAPAQKEEPEAAAKPAK